MRSLLTSTLVAVIGLAVLPAIPQRVEAGTGVLRCQMPDGTAVYSDTSCRALGGKAAPLPADVMDRIKRDQRRERQRVSSQAGMEMNANALQDQTSDVHASAPVRRPLARGCATTPQQLAMDLQGSVALGDVNRIAESFDWAGMGNEQAQPIMARLEQIARRSVRDAEYFDASIGQGLILADAGDAKHDGAAGLLQVTFDAGDGNSVVDLDVHRDEGCYFLRY